MTDDADAAIRLARAAEIRAGCESDGPDGALYRLMAIIDFELIDKWLTAEKIRGTDPNVRAQIVAVVMAHLATKTAFSVKEFRLMLSDIFSRAMHRAETETDRVERKMQSGPRLRIQ